MCLMSFFLLSYFSFLFLLGVSYLFSLSLSPIRSPLFVIQLSTQRLQGFFSLSLIVFLSFSFSVYFTISFCWKSLSLFLPLCVILHLSLSPDVKIHSRTCWILHIKSAKCMSLHWWMHVLLWRFKDNVGVSASSYFPCTPLKAATYFCILHNDAFIHF